MKVKQYNIKLTLIFISVVASTILLFGCSNSTPIVNKTTRTSQVTFEDILQSYDQIRPTVDQMLVEGINDKWWNDFSSCYFDVCAMAKENKKIIDSNILNDDTLVNSKNFSKLINAYNESFEMIKAAANSGSVDILNDAYSEFNNKISSANDEWDKFSSTK